MLLKYSIFTNLEMNDLKSCGTLSSGITTDAQQYGTLLTIRLLVPFDY